MNVSSTFANALQKELAPLIGLKPTFHKFAGLMVLKAPDVPSVLLETGYISNEDDLALLTSDDYEHKIALAVRRAATTHFARQIAARTKEKDEE